MMIKSTMLFVFLSLCVPATYAENLMDVYQQALDSDPSLKAAQLQFELSETQQAQAGGALLPQINASVNWSFNERSIDTQDVERYEGKRYSLSLTQTIVDVSKVSNWLRYQALTGKSEADYQQAELILMYDLVDRYFTVLAGQDNLALSKQETATTEKHLEQVKRQFDKQIVKITDVYEMEAKLDSLLARQIEIETMLDIAKQSLIELTGAPVSYLAELRDDVQFKILSGDVQQVGEQAQINSPLIQAQNQEIQAADYDVISQNAKHLPVLDLQLQYYNTDNGFQNSLTPVVETKVVALNVTVPIFSGGSTHQRAKEANKQLRLSKQRKISIMRAIEKETRDAFLSANASVRRIKASTRSLKSAVKAREAMEKGFKYGMQSIGDVLISQAREYRAKKDLLVAKYTYIKNFIRFELASGTLSFQSLENINQWLKS